MPEQVPMIASLVPIAHRGKVLTQANKAIAIALLGLQVLLMAILLAPLPLGFAIGDWILPGNRWLHGACVVSGVLISVGLIWTLSGHLFKSPWSTQNILYQIRTHFSLRENCLVSLDHPDAIFAEVIPRRNWGQFWGEAEDIGFILVDEEKGLILFEGDNKRYRIPTDALVSSEVEAINADWEHYAHTDPVCVVTVRYREHDGIGIREVPFNPKWTVSGIPLGSASWEKAGELQRRIEDLMACNPPDGSEVE